MNAKTSLAIFCRNIHALRLRYGLSLPDMAALLEISGAELASIESGTVPRSVTIEILFHIQTHFGICPSRMFAPDFRP